MQVRGSGEKDVFVFLFRKLREFFRVGGLLRPFPLRRVLGAHNPKTD
jgi:hypothetical protein